MLKIPESKKHEYWNHFIARWAIEKIGGIHGMTGAKLRKVKSVIWHDDEEFWFDIVYRHTGIDRTPEQLEKLDKATYDHCLGNFWGMIAQEMVERGMIK